MKRILAGIAVAVFSATLALASDDPMANRYGNTTVVTNAKGEVTKLMYNKDGTMTIVQPDGSKITGKWAVKEGKLCITPDGGPMAGKEQCNPFDPSKKVGESWEVTTADGSKVKVAIVAGQN
jgi:YD repeat-containing protein